MSYQTRVNSWMVSCFGTEIPKDKIERNYRFFEEATELVQACGMTKEDALRLIDYVYDRPVGEIPQEIGGVAVTLSALATAHEIRLISAEEDELTRCWEKIEMIRKKQAEKKIKSSPLP